MIRKTAAALAALALSMSLVGCNGGSDDDCYEDEAGGTGVELVAAVDGRSGGSSGGSSGGGYRGGGSGSRSGGSKSADGSKGSSSSGSKSGSKAKVDLDDCDDD